MEQTVLLSPKEIAKLANLTTKTVLKRLNDGTIKGTKVGKRWHVDRSEFDRVFLGKMSESPRLGGPDLVKLVDLERVPKVLSDLEEGFDYLKCALETTSTLLKGAAANGVEAIYCPRRISNDSVEGIKELIVKAQGEILLSGISLRQFFGDKPFLQDLWSKLNGDRGSSVRALLLDPLSQAGKARIFVEEAMDGQSRDEYRSPKQLRRSVLYKDVERSLAAIKRLQGRLGSPLRLDARFYDCTPFAFFVLTNGGLIIEQYHFGREESPIGGCIGELVPLLRCSPSSSFCRVMKNSFNHLWEGQNPFVQIRKLPEVEAGMFGDDRRPKEVRRKRKR